ncbi:MAG: ATP-dependent zinc protease [Thermodesulfobacteriota bacterium]
MKLATRFLEKALIISLLVCFAAGCASESFLLQKKDLSGVNNGLDRIEDRLEMQSARTYLLMDQYIRQQQILNESMEQNLQSFKDLEKLTKQAHTDTSLRLEALESSREQDSDSKERILLENIGTDKLVVGRAENVRLTPPGHAFPARIDTGATTSSLGARDLETFERDGDPWVRFKLKDPEEDELYEIEKEVVRHARILQASSPEPERRAVIELQFQLGRIKMVEEFTLEERGHLSHNVLIGRNILRDLMVVDVARKFSAPLPEENSNGNGGK